MLELDVFTTKNTKFTVQHHQWAYFPQSEVKTRLLGAGTAFVPVGGAAVHKENQENIEDLADMISLHGVKIEGDKNVWYFSNED